MPRIWASANRMGSLATGLLLFLAAGLSPALCSDQIVTGYSGKNIKVYSAPGKRIDGFAASDLPDPAQAAIPVIERKDPYIKILSRSGKEIWLTTRAVKISGGGKEMPRAYQSAKPCLTKQKVGLGAGNSC